MEQEIKNLIGKMGSKQAVANELMISIRYVDMILAGKKPSRRLSKMIKIAVAMQTDKAA